MVRSYRDGSLLVECNCVHLLKYKFEVLVLYLSIFFSCHFLLLLHYISEGNIVLFTSPQLSDSFSYFTN